MARLNYETADTLVYDPVAAHRNSMRAVLFTLGFRNIETCATVANFSEAMRRTPPDLALCEVLGADAELCDMIQELRQGVGGHTNPFLVVIVTAWDKTNSLVQRVLNSGADDLLLRPFSTNILKQRIETHIERRKHFVITHDYVGPDRRSDPGRHSNVDYFLPPNSLKMKARDGLSAAEANTRLQKELALARDTLHTEKLRRDVFQICILWRLLQEPGDPGAEAHLCKLRTLIQAIAKRCRDTEFEAATQWCESVQAAVEGLHFGVDRNASMHLLGHAALNLNQVVHPDKSKADHLKFVESTVAMIRMRAAGRSTADDPLLQTGSA